jgi:hypothetical protein
VIANYEISVQLHMDDHVISLLPHENILSVNDPYTLELYDTAINYLLL